MICARGEKKNRLVFVQIMPAKRCRDAVCCICFEKCSSTLVCGHVLHDECASRWFRRSPTCPVCRKVDLEHLSGAYVFGCLRALCGEDEVPERCIHMAAVLIYSLARDKPTVVASRIPPIAFSRIDWSGNECPRGAALDGLAAVCVGFHLNQHGSTYYLDAVLYSQGYECGLHIFRDRGRQSPYKWPIVVGRVTRNSVRNALVVKLMASKSLCYAVCECLVVVQNMQPPRGQPGSGAA